ncbi:polysaccharide export outer membrane protein [Methylohalomonas lacus]|uniref:Polysaccharide export outer membrane protein n=1 Tax=Methylohalomonas lacus TaxID=398773 RepID=A0AAE3HMY9_9GAMM|nr:XrtA/PEP-CTERM system exopolysaccharide export protein [Methylohalomonas lacus]MCS3904338.1 polysaccharide export outer membrane protein [Methylohalomonas lacus]
MFIYAIETTVKNTFLFLLLTVMTLSGCAQSLVETGDPAPAVKDYSYTIAPGDRLDIFVWRNEDISVSDIPVMPDGRISSPLVGDIMASGKTPIQLAKDIEMALVEVIRDPLVTVTVVGIVGAHSQQIRVVGEAAEPRAIPYRNDMTLLDVMIEVGGLTEFAAGNRAIIVRNINGSENNFNVKIDDLIKQGDLSANTEVAPGDILVIPESYF